MENVRQKTIKKYIFKDLFVFLTYKNKVGKEKYKRIAKAVNL